MSQEVESVDSADYGGDDPAVKQAILAVFELIADLNDAHVDTVLRAAKREWERMHAIEQSLCRTPQEVINRAIKREEARRESQARREANAQTVR